MPFRRLLHHVTASAINVIAVIELIPHQLHPDPLEIRSRVMRNKDELVLTYRLEGSLDQLVLPQKALRSEFKDELWKNTCFEAFLQIPESSEYCEFNFSPSGHFAAYHFSSYRTGMKPILNFGTPQIRMSMNNSHSLEFSASMTLPEPWASAPLLSAAITSVIEEKNSGVSYWAIRHKLGRPDFHDSAGFVVSLKTA